METSRLFVANLPSNVRESDITRLIKDYGEIVNVEIKTKENLVDPQDVKVIAFVTLRIDSSDLQYCINELSWQKINGCQIKVSVAKESFLDRLKRERMEAEAAAKEDKNDFAPVKSHIPYQKLENTRKTFDVDADLADVDVPPELLITKKRASSSLHNGKIIIQSYDNAPVHIIEAKRTLKQVNSSKPANQKRKESVNKMKQQYQQKKSTIQKALSGLETNKKIRFSDGDNEEFVTNASEKLKSKVDLFGSDEEAGNVHDLKIEDKHFGKNGEKLLKLQSKQSLDSRFKMNENFVDNEDDIQNGVQTEVCENDDNERNWQMGILEEVIGVKLDTEPMAEKAKRKKNMLRFDPAKDEHKKYLLNNKDLLEESLLKSAHKSIEETNHNDTMKTNEVSKEVFYVVTDTLHDSLKSRGDEFSLLSMFGKVNEMKQREDQLKQISNEKILINKARRNVSHPFNYDSSTDSDDDTHAENVMDSVSNNQHDNNKKKQKVKIAVESFFIPKNDIRLKEGAKFFKVAKKDNEEEDYEEVRNRLGLLIKRKISKAKKNIASVKGKNKKHKP